VIVLDAENPLEEIHGEFFWREDHEVLLAAARDEAFRTGHDQGYRQGHAVGYAVGWEDSARQQPPARLVVRRHRSMLGWVRLVIAVMLLAAFGPLLLSVALQQVLTLR
jgi:hypothetical protein